MLYLLWTEGLASCGVQNTNTAVALRVTKWFHYGLSLSRGYYINIAISINSYCALLENVFA